MNGDQRKYPAGQTELDRWIPFTFIHVHSRLAFPGRQKMVFQNMNRECTQMNVNAQYMVIGQERGRSSYTRSQI